MKRFWFSIMALLLMAVLSPNYASAAVVTCQPVNSNTGYPQNQWTQFCTGVTQANANTFASAAGHAHGTASSELLRANNGNFLDANMQPANGFRYFLFANPQDYSDSAASLGLGTAESISNKEIRMTLVSFT